LYADTPTESNTYANAQTPPDAASSPDAAVNVLNK
jgi:hypothetical protein